LGNDGLPIRIFGVIQDVTDARRAQQQLFASQKLESIGLLANGIAHDFNNLLSSVLAQAELALAELAAGSKPAHELDAIRSVAVRGSEIVRQLMIYSGKDAEVGGPVNVSRVVTELMQLITISVSKHASIETDLLPDLPPVQCTPEKIAQIVMNLVINASEAIGNTDGLIRIRTLKIIGSPDASAPVPPALSPGPHIQLEVNDTGCGMSRETQAHMFDPFFTTKTAGHGLGLAVVHGIVRGIGGSIAVESELGSGSTVRITLPCVDHSPDCPVQLEMEKAFPH
jgi:signal transduction histidine kinase